MHPCNEYGVAGPSRFGRYFETSDMALREPVTAPLSVAAIHASPVLPNSVMITGADTEGLLGCLLDGKLGCKGDNLLGPGSPLPLYFGFWGLKVLLTIPPGAVGTAIISSPLPFALPCAHLLHHYENDPPL